MESVTTPFADWAAASAALEGEAVSGDRAVVSATADGLLIAGVDGVGHGEEAARAADAAVVVLEEFLGAPPDELLRRCHHALQGTRGAAMMAAWFDAARMSLAWVGVGEILAVLIRANAASRPRRQLLLPWSGVAGQFVSSYALSDLAIEPADTLVLATDGIEDRFMEDAAMGEPPSRLADHILARHRRPQDDALVIVVRFSGSPA